MEDGEKYADICSSLGLTSAAVSTIMAKAEKTKQSAQKTTKLRASNLSYTGNFKITKWNYY
jgi:protein-disulfide isomerase-like protein with CxxC motif